MSSLGRTARTKTATTLSRALGTAAHVVQSIAWLAMIAEADAEHDHDGREPDADDELLPVLAFEAA